LSRVRCGITSTTLFGISLTLALKWVLLLPGAALLLLFLFLYINLFVTTHPLSAVQLFVYLGIPVLEAAAVVGVFVSAKRNHSDWTTPLTATIWCANLVNIVLGFLRVFGM
jgi:hypothetical protein